MKYKALCNEFGAWVVPAATLIPISLGVLGFKITGDLTWMSFLFATGIAMLFEATAEGLSLAYAHWHKMGVTKASKMIQRNQIISYSAGFLAVIIPTLASKIFNSPVIA